MVKMILVIYIVENIKHYANLFKDEKADIVTGDGGFDFSDDYSNQEILHLTNIL